MTDLVERLRRTWLPGDDPWEAADDAPEARKSAQKTEEHQARASWRDSGTDLRMKAHEVLDLVPSREIPTALAFLEFLRSRRSGYRHARYS